ncbi:predicted protein [Naegleria gruberi]|uniref:Predicted protein n=1 Tax=Naegleria gruberi TaxID=5762 RepID=D2W0I6_NAEGR|nr:uncharacterized protein NAEGRDRAFT_53733 [Naegleria gruberi]EFC37485.1 predicted protein [Naegleria gruberi]|eukprot:XP_002670229.1 predicted protein [Naegleria gruberi strain NEG-M]
MFAQHVNFFTTNNNNNNNNDTDFLSHEDAMHGWNEYQAAQRQQFTSSVASVGSEVMDEFATLFKTMDEFIFPVVVEKVGLEEHLPAAEDQQMMSLDDIYQQLRNSALSPTSSTSSASYQSQDVISTGAASSSSNKESTFDQSTFVQKKKKSSKKAKQDEEKTVNKRAKKNSADDWQYTKFSESNSYLEINTNTPEVTIAFEVYQTKRRQTVALKSDKDTMTRVCEISFQISNLDTTKTNYVSLKKRFDKEAIYGNAKPTKLSTWIRLKGTEEYLFFYCQTGKSCGVHNVVNYEFGKLETRSTHLSKYSTKCSNGFHIIRSKTD